MLNRDETTEPRAGFSKAQLRRKNFAPLAGFLAARRRNPATWN
jgi:hypothetical protein